MRLVEVIWRAVGSAKKRRERGLRQVWVGREEGERRAVVRVRVEEDQHWKRPCNVDLHANSNYGHNFLTLSPENNLPFPFPKLYANTTVAPNLAKFDKHIASHTPPSPLPITRLCNSTSRWTAMPMPLA